MSLDSSLFLITSISHPSHKPHWPIQKSAIINRFIITTFSQTVIISCLNCGTISSSDLVSALALPVYFQCNGQDNLLRTHICSPVSSLLMKNNKILTQSHQRLQVLSTATCQCHLIPPLPWLTTFLTQWPSRWSSNKTCWILPSGPLLCFEHPPLGTDTSLPSDLHSNITLLKRLFLFNIVPKINLSLSLLCFSL